MIDILPYTADIPHVDTGGERKVRHGRRNGPGDSGNLLPGD